jgi:hypothetical protein
VRVGSLKTEELPLATQEKPNQWRSNLRQSGMAWDDVSETYANLGWVWEGVGVWLGYRPGTSLTE